MFCRVCVVLQEEVLPGHEGDEGVNGGPHGLYVSHETTGDTREMSQDTVHCG